MGLDSAINRYIPVCLANQDSRGIDKVLSSSYYFSLAVMAAILCFSVVIYLNLGNWFEIQPELIKSASWLVLIVGCSFALIVPLQRSSAVLSGLQRYDITNAIELSLLLARTLLLVVMLAHGYGLLTVGAIFGASEILMRLLQFFFSRKLLPHNSIALKDFDFRLLKEMAFYGTNTLLYTMAVLILTKSSSIIIGIFLGTAQIGHFSVAIAAVLILSTFCQVFSRAIKPAVSDLDARSDNRKIKELSFLAQKYSLLMLIPASCFLIVMGADFLRVWLGQTIQDATTLDLMGKILVIYAMAHFVRLAQQSNFVVLVGRGEHKVFGISMLITAVSFVASAVVCLKVFKMGLLAVAWCNFVPVVLFLGVFLQFYFNKKMNIRLVETAVRVALPALLGTLPAVLLIIAWKLAASPDSWMGLLSVIVATGLVTLPCSWFLALSKLERQRFAQIIIRKRS